MNIVEIIKELRKEQEKIDKLILALDTLQYGRRRGRPPKLLQELRARAKRKEAPARKARKKAKKATSKRVS